MISKLFRIALCAIYMTHAYGLVSKLATYGIGLIPNCLRHSPDGQHFLVCSKDSLSIYKLNQEDITLSPLLVSIGIYSNVQDAQYIEDGSGIVALIDGEGYLFPAKDVSKAGTAFGLPAGDLMSCMHVADNGKSVVFGTGARSYKVYNLPARTLFATVGNPRSGSLSQACYINPAGTDVAASQSDPSWSTYGFWSVPGNVKHTLIGTSATSIPRNYAPIHTTDRHVYGTNSGVVRVNNSKGSLSNVFYRVYGGAITAVDTTRDGKYLLACNAGGLFTVHGIDAGRDTKRTTAHAAGATYCAFAPNGQTVLTVGADNKIHVWDPFATKAPTDSPTSSPSKSPTSSPSKSPTGSPTKSPTVLETESPTDSPTSSPTTSPTGSPTDSPTKSPTSSPTTSPTDSPTSSPTASPTGSPTDSPTKSPTSSPTTSPTDSPTDSPTKSPTSSPTTSPTGSPTESPTKLPTSSPTESPTKLPTVSPTYAPTSSPTCKSVEDKLDILFMVNTSPNSVSGRDWDNTKKFLLDFSDQFEISPRATRFGIISFNTKLDNVAEFGYSSMQTKDGFADFVNGMKQKKGRTASGLALLRAQYIFNENDFRPESKRVLIMLSGRTPTSAEGCTENGYDADPVTCAREIMSDIKFRKSRILRDVEIISVQVGGEIENDLYEGISDHFVDCKFKHLQEILVSLRDTLVC